MPYIPGNARNDYDDCIDNIVGILIEGGEPQMYGELNYVVSSIIVRLIQEKGISYALVQNLLGTLECSKMEIYRRLLVPYEDNKMYANGDIL